MIDSIKARESARHQLERLMSNYQGRVAVVPGFTAIKPLPPRSCQIDPETRLKRRERYIRPLHQGSTRDCAGFLTEEDRQRIRSMAKQL